MTISFNLDEFTNQFKTGVAATLTGVNNIVHATGEEVYNRVIDKSPVGDPTTWNPPYWPKGYVPGQFKKSWQVIYGQNEFTIANPVIYAQRLEEGWSQQAPTGVLRTTLLELNDIFNMMSIRYRIT